MRVVGKQHQRGQACRANGVTLGHSLGGVAHGIQWVGDVAHAAGHFGHFGNAARVVGDGAISVQRHHDTRHAQHGCSRYSDAVQATQRISRPDGQTDEHHRPGGGAHGHAQTGNDVGAVAGGRGLGDVLHRGVLRAGVELGDPDQGGREHKTHSTGAKQFHLAARSAQGVVRHQPGGDEVKGDQGQHARDGQAFVERRHHIGHARSSLDEEATNDGGDDGHRAQGQRVQHGLTWGSRNQ